jgi:tetratricopeptide (TPR) repeat protein
MADNKIGSNLDSVTKSKQDNIINILSELKKIKDEGNVLYENNNLEEAKNVFLNGYNLFHKEIKVIDNANLENIMNEIFIEYKKILSKLANCYYKQEKYEDSIIYDLKLIELEPKNCKSLARLFYSYSKLNKCQQAIFYGEIIMDLSDDGKNKFMDISKKVIEEKNKLSKIQEKEFLKHIFIAFGSVTVVILAAFLFYILKNN